MDRRLRLLAFMACLVAPCSIHAQHAARWGETLGRGVVAARTDDGVYIGWRLLESDPADIAFNVYRTLDGGSTRLNASPISASTNFVDASAPANASPRYRVVPVIAGKEGEPSDHVSLLATESGNAFRSIRLGGDYGINKIAIADLDGDGAYDFVIKQPARSVDPGGSHWRPSPDTYTLEAYRSDGRLLWRKDLGWNIERGIWYSPYVVADLDGDGRAEVAHKAGEEGVDHRDAEGHVLTGPEYCDVLDGATGERIARVDWIARGKLTDWGDEDGNRASRNLIGVAHLDGKRASLLVARGTYTVMRIDAYNLVDGKLEPVWSWSGENETPPVRGQGTHGMRAIDVDEDGRDEIVIGAAVLDDNGRILWNLGMGHPDVVYVTDIIPDRPGLEIAYGFEIAQERNGISVADARTGELIWGHDRPTIHIHDQGMLADVDPANPGLEFYGAEKDRSGYWLYAARTGKLLSDQSLGSISPRAFYWLDGPHKVFSPFRWRSRAAPIIRYPDQQIGELPGRIIAIADILGDWREEVIVTHADELRVYTTTVPSASRRTCLMQDPVYRTDVAHVSMGYLYPPQLTQPLAAD